METSKHSTGTIAQMRLRDEITNQQAIDALQIKKRRIEDNPANKTLGEKSFYIYKPEARKKLERIAWAIQNTLSDIKKEDKIG